MTQTQMTYDLAYRIGMRKKDAKLTRDELYMLVVRDLKKEGSIRLSGLGIFRAGTDRLTLIDQSTSKRSWRRIEASLSRTR